MTQGAVCRCGHPRQAHEHYRPGSDCGFCGPQVCGRYAAAETFGARVVRALRRALGR